MSKALGWNLPYSASEFDLPLCVQSGQVFRWQPVGENLWEGIAGTTLFVVQIGVHLTLHAYPDRDGLFHFTRLFRLEEDLKRIHSCLIRAEPFWEVLIKALPGLRLVRWDSAEECLFSFLCTSANNIPRITSMIKKLSDTYGEVVIAERNGRLYKAFPSAEVLAFLEESDLVKLGFGYRGRLLISAARALLERGAGWLESLREVPYEEAKKELMQLPGVGAKIADCVLLFALDKPEAVPVDTHLWQAMSQWILPELRTKSLTERTYRLITDWFHHRFGTLSNWAHQYLFTAHLKGFRFAS